MDKTTTEINHLKEGGFILIDDVPCKVDRVTISTSGKHGHSKVRVDAIGLMDGTRRSIIKPGGETVQVPIVEKKNGQVISIAGNKAQIMDLTDFSVFELDIPPEKKDKVRQGEEIFYFTVGEIKTLKELK